MTTQELRDTLESLVDRADLGTVILELARVCNEKAEHLRINWQDEASARMWDKAARQLDKLTTVLPV